MSSCPDVCSIVLYQHQLIVEAGRGRVHYIHAVVSNDRQWSLILSDFAIATTVTLYWLDTEEQRCLRLLLTFFMKPFHLTYFFVNFKFLTISHFHSTHESASILSAGKELCIFQRKVRIMLF